MKQRRVYMQKLWRNILWKWLERCGRHLLNTSLNVHAASGEGRVSNLDACRSRLPSAGGGLCVGRSYTLLSLSGEVLTQFVALFAWLVEHWVHPLPSTGVDG